MLDPQSRRLLLDALSPPPGYRFDRAVGTTFTLDLLALLTAPLAFSLIDITEGDGGRPVADPLALLEAARRHATRISIFTDAGHVAVPKSGQPLFALLEESVVPVMAPRRGGHFHPKVWLVRYLADGDAPVLRLLCSSRNLTFDHSWDTLLVLDGAVTASEVPQSEPVARFIEALPQMAVTPPPQRIRDDVTALAADARATRFVAPAGLEIGAFHPMGFGSEAGDPISGRIDRLLVISPFVGGSRLRKLAGRKTEQVLLSRPEELATVSPEDLGGYSEILVLSDLAVAEPRDDDADGTVEAFPAGLHAKVYAADAGWDARLWTGSANATDQAFTTNVEFMVELRGRKKVCGIDAILRSGTSTPGLRDMLESYRMHSVVVEEDGDETRWRHLVDLARAAVTRTPMSAHVAPDASPDRYELRLESSPGVVLEIPDGVSVTCRPITLGDGGAVTLETGGPLHARFTGLAVRDLSAFFAISVSVDGVARVMERFTLAVPLDGAPADRAAAILSQLLLSRRDLLRFLLLLLAADESRMSERLNDLRRIFGVGVAEGSNGGGGLPLLEPMLHTLARDPSRIDQIARVIEELEGSAEGRERLPVGLDDVWPAIWAARERMRP